MITMRLYNANLPSLYVNQPLRLRRKAQEIANQLLDAGVDEQTALLKGLERAREFFLGQWSRNNTVSNDLPGLP